MLCVFFFFNDTATTEIYTLSLHDALPICILDTLCDYAVEQGIIEDTAGNRELFDTKIMGKLTPSPSQVIDRFRETSEFSKEVATRKFYEFSQKTNYIRMDRIAKKIGRASCRERV